jgi:hypothetical protein
MTYIPDNAIRSTLNNSLTPLLTGQTFTGQNTGTVSAVMRIREKW